MKIFNISKRFKDNAQKYKRIICVHWLAGDVDPSIEWLDGRANKKGSIAYNEMIAKNGDLTILADPREGWFHNTNLGTVFDRGVIGIALELKDERDLVTDEIISTLRSRLDKWKDIFNITEVTSHHKLYPPKPDFPDQMFDEIMRRVYFT